MQFFFSGRVFLGDLSYTVELLQGKQVVKLVVGYVIC